MSFHIEYRVKGDHRREGTYDSRGEAVLAALRAKAEPALIVENAEGADAGTGDVVAVVLKRGEIVSVGPAPEWWGSIREPSRKKLLAGGVLDAKVVADVTEAGGSVFALDWESGPMSEWELTPPSDHDWVRAEAAVRGIRSQA